MLPRSDVQWLDAGLTVAEALRSRLAAWRAHSWYPVCRLAGRRGGVVSVARLLELGPDACRHDRSPRAARRCLCRRR